MRTLIHYLFIAGLALFLAACAGSRKGSEGPVVKVQNEQLQAQIDALQKQVEKNPNNLGYRRQLATVYHENGFNVEAMKVLEKGFAIDPNDAESRYLYAQIALANGQKEKAYQAYKEVLQSPSGMDYLDRIAPQFVDVFQVTKVIGTPAQEGFANFSADGKKIIYQSDQNGNWDIFEYDMETQASKPLVATPAQEENPEFSPDGRKIVYTSTMEDHRDVDFNQKRRDIYIMGLNDHRQINLTTNGSDDWAPRYSADGNYITFVSTRSDLRDVPFYQLFGHIFVMERDGRFQLQLSEGEFNDGNPCIAPGSTEEDGTIYFDSDRSGYYAIYQTDFKGQKVRQITFTPKANDVAPEISSSNEKIVFFSDRDGNYELYMMNSDGSAQQRLTANPADDLNPSFSPDGQKVIFHSNRDGNYDIFIMDLSQKAPPITISDLISRIDRAM